MLHICSCAVTASNTLLIKIIGISYDLKSADTILSLFKIMFCSIILDFFPLELESYRKKVVTFSTPILISKKWKNCTINISVANYSGPKVLKFIAIIMSLLSIANAMSFEY